MKRVLTPVKAIRAKCLDCSCGQVKEIRECPVMTCPLWPYRMGKRPKHVVGSADAAECQAVRIGQCSHTS